MTAARTAKSAADELAARAKVSALTEAEYRHRTSLFEHWCENMGLDTAQERSLLAYLYAHPEWSSGQTKAVLSAVTWCARQGETSASAGHVVRAHLRERQQAKGKSALPQTEPLRAHVAVEIAHALERQSSEPAGRPEVSQRVTALRAVLVVARATAARGDTLDEACTRFVRAGACTIEQDGSGAQLRAQGRLVAALTPDAVDTWATVLAYGRTGRDAARRRMRGAIDRTGLQRGAPASAVTAEQWAWLWANLDSDTPRRVRDRAYMLVGLSHARRHQELRKCRIEDIERVGDDYVVTYRRTKNGDDYVGTVAHQSAREECTAACPACALEELLDFERVCRGRRTGPLFSTIYGGKLGAMTRQNGRHRMRHLTAQLGDSPWGSTRSLRAGAATSAAEAGWSLPRIARLTGHRDLATTEVYIRRAGATTATLQLNLDTLE